MSDEIKNGLDPDPIETQEWLDSLSSVIKNEGKDRARYILKRLIADARQKGTDVPYGLNTPYVNTISIDKEPSYPGDEELELKIAILIRWNAVAMVLRAGKKDPELGGHIATFASAATLY